MNLPPVEPLYVVGQRSHLMYLLERQELEDQGLGDPFGVVMILSDALNWRFARPYGKNQDGELFMNAERCVHRLTPSFAVLDRLLALSSRSRQNAQIMCNALGLKGFTTVDVAHRVRCYGVVIRHRDGWGIAYVALPP